MRRVDPILGHPRLHADRHFGHVALLLVDEALRDLLHRLNQAAGHAREERGRTPRRRLRAVDHALRIEREELVVGIELLDYEIHVEIARVDFEGDIPPAGNILGPEAERGIVAPGDERELRGRVVLLAEREHLVKDAAPEGVEIIRLGLREHKDSVGIRLLGEDTGVVKGLVLRRGLHLHRGGGERGIGNELKIIDLLHGHIGRGPEDELGGSRHELALHGRRGDELRIVGARVTLHLDLVLMRREGARDAARIRDLPAEALPGAHDKRIPAVVEIAQPRPHPALLDRAIPHDDVDPGDAELIRAALVAPNDLKEVLRLIDLQARAREGYGALVGARLTVALNERLPLTAFANLIHVVGIPPLRDYALIQLLLVEPLYTMDPAGPLDIRRAHRKEDLPAVAQARDRGPVFPDLRHRHIGRAIPAQATQDLAVNALARRREGDGDPRKRLALPLPVLHEIDEIGQHLRLQHLRRSLGRGGGAAGIHGRGFVKRQHRAHELGVLQPIHGHDGDAGIVAVHILRGEFDLGAELLAHRHAAQPPQERGDAGSLGAIAGLDRRGLHLGPPKGLLGHRHLIVDNRIKKGNTRIRRALKRQDRLARIRVLATVLALPFPHIVPELSRPRLPHPHAEAIIHGPLQITTRLGKLFRGALFKIRFHGPSNSRWGKGASRCLLPI